MAAPIAPSGAQVRSRLHRLAATLHTLAAQCPDELEPALAIAVAFVVDTEGDAIARDLAAMLACEELLGLRVVKGHAVTVRAAVTVLRPQPTLEGA